MPVHGWLGNKQLFKPLGRDVETVALVKSTERYIFIYDEESNDALLRTLGQFAADKELSFTWYDAAVLSQKVRRLKEEREAEARMV